MKMICLTVNTIIIITLTVNDVTMFNDEEKQLSSLYENLLHVLLAVIHKIIHLFTSNKS